MAHTFRPHDEPVYEPGAEEGCSRVWATAEAGVETMHVCSRPDGHDGLHRSADARLWNGEHQKTYLIWSMDKKKWLAPGFRGYVDGTSPADAGRYDITDARKTCRREEMPMIMWASTVAWPVPIHGMPCIYLPAEEVPEQLDAAELDQLIKRAASLQIKGWAEYWREVGKEYATCP